VDEKELQARIDLHVANLKFGFERRMKNLALAAGLAMCLLCDINSLTIWKTLYTDQQLRTTFATDYSKKAMQLIESSKDFPPEQAKTNGATATTTKTPTNEDKLTKAQLDQKAKDLQGTMENFLADVKFGVGRVWQKPPLDRAAFFFEFLGSLLTGILISIGAPYWHDLLRALSNLRKTNT